MTCILRASLGSDCDGYSSSLIIQRNQFLMSQQPQQTVPSAPDSPAVVVTSNVQKYAIKKKKVLSAEEAELFELTQAAGITVDQEVFKIIVDLLKMNVAPQAVFQTLKAMCAGQRLAESNTGESSSASQTTSINPAPTEARGPGRLRMTQLRAGWPGWSHGAEIIGEKPYVVPIKTQLPDLHRFTLMCSSIICQVKKKKKDRLCVQQQISHRLRGQKEVFTSLQRKSCISTVSKYV
ncbi:mitotic-spindle organizing protein 2 isoform X2 [Channa argus]|uniref:mitotic-spindle organizing protein 2 isoform X2 n=1 Tax=Channa argus TaxID=215402 RepID=UPI00352227EE